jgi:hypothetical protein
MPEITRFYGIIIKLFFADHPPPHFHAIYGDYSNSWSYEVQWKANRQIIELTGFL